MKYLVLVLFLGIVSYGYSQDSAYKALLEKEYEHTVPVIQPKDLYNKLQSGEEITLLDTRSKSEYNVSLIEGALHVGFLTFTGRKVREIDTDEFIVVYCTVGVRSESVGEKLLKNGYEHVYNLYGGIIEWVNEGYPVVDDQGKSTENVHVYSKDWGKWLKKGHPVY